jgi:hypothetical protein
MQMNSGDASNRLLRRRLLFAVALGDLLLGAYASDDRRLPSPPCANPISACTTTESSNAGPQPVALELWGEDGSFELSGCSLSNDPLQRLQQIRVIVADRTRRERGSHALRVAERSNPKTTKAALLPLKAAIQLAFQEAAGSEASVQFVEPPPP